MKFDYPRELFEQWVIALNVFKPYIESIKYLVSFGSFHNNDFYYIKMDNNYIFLSDFEFAVIMNNDKLQDNQLKQNINNSVAEYNNRYSKNHFGHNLNIKINNLTEFVTSLNNNLYFKNTLIRTGNTFITKNNFNEIFTNDSETIPIKTISNVFHYHIIHSLLHLDKRFVNDISQYDTYVLHDITKLGFKMIALSSVIYNYYPYNYSDAYIYLMKNRIILPIDFKQLNFIKNQSLKSTNQILGKAINQYIDLLQFVFNLINKKEKATDHLRCDLDLLIDILKVYCIKSNTFEELRIKRVEKYLSNKQGENYNYYREIYGVL